MWAIGRQAHLNAAGAESMDMLAHDLRTPMTCVAGAAQTALLKLSRGQGADEQLQQILLAIGAMDRLLAQHCGEAEGKRRLDARALSAEVRSLLDGRAGEKGQRFVVDLAPLEGAVLREDGAVLPRVLVNLAGNAIKYTQPGGHVALHGRLSVSGGRSFAVFCVEDDGPGMRAAFLRHAFEPFARARETSGEAGSGLGLAITRRLVRRMGGEIRVHSEWGRGSTFVVRVPLARRAAQLH